MPVLSSPLRKQLEAAVLAGRRASESASRAALDGLAVFADRRPEHLDDGQAALRNGLRAKWRQLGGDRELLIAECAYEQWHRLLFARFLAENNLLLHPQFRAPVTLQDCDELAAELGEPDGWAVAARFAAEILPGIFRIDDPCVRLRLAPEGRFALEEVITALPAETFAADDALGWVYQFWQKDKKDEINASERKIGGADLGPLTQLFTENYMVRFLLENSLGAWWAARHPDSTLIKGFDYLRFDDDRRPAAGEFDGWPDRVAEVTVMDPCCGSGHFLVEAFSMLWQMRAEDEGISPVAAQDAVLRDNLFGLELDPRCVQIAMFAVALQAWKAAGSWRQLPMPNIACSGLPVKASVEEWKALAGGDQRIESALLRLHNVFRDADTLGSLIDPRRAAEMGDSAGSQSTFEDASWSELLPLIVALSSQETEDPALAVLGARAASLARVAPMLAEEYTLAITNPPFLKRGSQAPGLREHNDSRHGAASPDLATAILDRWRRNSSLGTAFVLPSSWTYQGAYQAFRSDLVRSGWPSLLVVLGTGAFEAISGEIVNVSLAVGCRSGSELLNIADIRDAPSAAAKALALRACATRALLLADIRRAPDARIVLDADWSYQQELLSSKADGYIGFQSGDNPRYRRMNWEVTDWSRWRPLQSTFDTTGDIQAGCDEVIDWRQDGRHFATELGSRMQGSAAWGKRGVAVSLMGELRCALYHGYIHDNSTGVVLPHRDSDLAAIWNFMKSPAYPGLVRQIDRSLKVNATSLVKVPIDMDHWRQVAEASEPLPEPSSDDPRQWLFEGRPEVSTAALQVAVARLVGYRWPEQAQSDDLDAFADADGIVCLPPVAGEAPAADRLQQALVSAFDVAWAPTRVKDLLMQASSKKKNLAEWLRDEFFKQHCTLFGNRPFVWHIWDGQKDGFAALVDYHRLDRQTLEKLTYSYLGQDWVERQRAGVRDELAGADNRLGAALALQRKLEVIVEGEEPFDIYVRWKGVHEQPVGWDPDLNDGVRFNIRPFVDAGVLRSPVNVHWRKDRGKNRDGSERHNDIHLSLAEKLDARKKAGVP